MQNRGVSRLAFLLGLAVATLLMAPAALRAADGRPPNIVIFFTDDQGYADVGCFGAKDIRTPHFDRLAREGMRFTDFYVSQPVCTASRASLMTGCYANRVGLAGALNHTSREGIHPDETLLSELCKSRGYSTACYGKWHLGTAAMFNPTLHGFDDFLGIPYSNDNSKYHPVLADSMPPLPLYEGTKVIEEDPDQSQFTRRFTERAVAFIDRNHDRPFLLYMPHVMPHVPIFASKKFVGKSGRGLYGDVIEELDWSLGQVLAALARHQLDEKTLVIFASDNGPFLSYGEHAGRATPLREGKLTTFEGGVRVPCIMRWAGKTPAGSECRQMCSTIDLLPTIAGLIGAELPKRKLDGRDIRPLLEGKQGAASPHEALFFYAGQELQAIRCGRWKLHFPHSYLTVAAEPGRNGKPSNWGKLKPASITQSGLEGIASRHGYRVEKIALSLFDLSKDIGEEHNVAKEHPDVVQRMTKLAEAARADLGDKLTGRQGANLRPAGKAD